MQSPVGSLNERIASATPKELVWRRNAPYFYQTLYMQELTWPSLAVEWWVDDSSAGSRSSDETTLAYLTYGTHTSNTEQNYLIMAKVYLPNQQYLRKNLRQRPPKASDSVRKNDNAMEDRVVVLHEVEHEGQVNRIKRHPKLSHLIATRTPLGEIHVFDKTKFKTGRVKVAPCLVLAGHQTEGYSIEWNPHKENMMVGGSFDGKLTMWDIQNRDTRKLFPICEFPFHQREIEDISHHQFHDSLFASCDDGGHTALWDIRHPAFPVHHFSTSHSEQRCVQFSPLNQHLFATAAEGPIKFWDVRNMSESLCQLDSPDSLVNQLSWSTTHPHNIWSVSGSKITMWDIQQLKPKFVHGGHTEAINYMDIHPHQPHTIASVDESNDIQIFQPTPNAHL